MECPYCQTEVEIRNGRCPNCKERLYNVTEEDFVEGSETFEDMDVDEAIQSRFLCVRCGGEECSVKEVAMTGTGLSKMFDIHHNHYLFISCEQCGKVEIYDPKVLRGHKPGTLGTILDALFGG